MPTYLYDIAGDTVAVEVEGSVENFTVVGVAEPSGSRTSVTLRDNLPRAAGAAPGVWLDFEAGNIDLTETSATWSGRVGVVGVEVRLDKAPDGYNDLIRESLRGVVRRIAWVPEDFARDALASPAAALSTPMPAIPIGDGSHATALMYGSLAGGIRYQLELPSGEIWGSVLRNDRMGRVYAEVKTGGGYAAIYQLRPDVAIEPGALEFMSPVYGAGGILVVTPVLGEPVTFELRSEQTGARETLTYEPGDFFASTREG
jgi:hypothetical protein